MGLIAITAACFAAAIAYGVLPTFLRDDSVAEAPAAKFLLKATVVLSSLTVLTLSIGHTIDHFNYSWGRIFSESREHHWVMDEAMASWARFASETFGLIIGLYALLGEKMAEALNPHWSLAGYDMARVYMIALIAAPFLYPVMFLAVKAITISKVSLIKDSTRKSEARLKHEQGFWGLTSEAFLLRFLLFAAALASGIYLPMFIVFCLVPLVVNLAYFGLIGIGILLGLLFFGFLFGGRMPFFIVFPSGR